MTPDQAAWGVLVNVLVFVGVSTWAMITSIRDGFDTVDYVFAAAFFVLWVFALVGGSWMAVALLPVFVGIWYMGDGR